MWEFFRLEVSTELLLPACLEPVGTAWMNYRIYRNFLIRVLLSIPPRGYPGVH